MPKKTKVLLFASYYFPGYKAGGPIKTIFNMVENLSDDIEFWIVTRDRDLGDNKAYQNIMSDKWCDVGRAKVLYQTQSKQGMLALSKVIKSTQCDAVYLNSFFDISFSIKVLLARRLGMYQKLPIIIAPRGEFSEGALSLKSLKKNIFIRLASLFGLYKNVLWQASTKHEKHDILSKMDVNDDEILIAKDLPEKRTLVSIKHHANTKSLTKLKVIFLSRISPMKNLTYALKILSHVTRDVVFDIYGPIEDSLYWEQCTVLIKQLPNNIQVTYHGKISPEKVSETFIKYDIFLLPTLGENYGHVIAESLLVGTPVLISDQTPWKNLLDDGLGWDIALQDQKKFVDVINHYREKLDLDNVWSREKVRSQALKCIYNPLDIEDNKNLFRLAISLSKKV